MFKTSAISLFVQICSYIILPFHAFTRPFLLGLFSCIVLHVRAFLLPLSYVSLSFSDFDVFSRAFAAPCLAFILRDPLPSPGGMCFPTVPCIFLPFPAFLLPLPYLFRTFPYFPEVFEYFQYFSKLLTLPNLLQHSSTFSNFLEPSLTLS